MPKNAVPPKSKAPPSDSSEEEETGSNDEEIEGEEQAKGGFSFESGSDASTDTTTKEPISSSPSRQPSAGKAAAPAKRTRQSRQSIGKEDESGNKRSKPEVATPASRAAPKAEAQ